MYDSSWISPKNRATPPKYDDWPPLEEQVISAEREPQSFYEKFLRIAQRTKFSPRSYVIPKHNYEIALDEDGIEELMTLIGGHYENSSDH